MKLLLSLLMLSALAVAGCATTTAVEPAPAAAASPVVAAAPSASQVEEKPYVVERIVEVKECTKQVGKLLQTDTCPNCAPFPISLRVPGVCR